MESELIKFATSDQVRHQRQRERYDLISFGGGSCLKVVGPYARNYGWKSLCFLTNGSDNGGSTQKIVEALRPDYGPTLPVGDITSGLIGLMPPFRFELMNLRGWKLDPLRFSADEQQAFSRAISSQDTFHGCLTQAISVYQQKFALDPHDPAHPHREFCRQLLALGRCVDECGLIRKDVKGLTLGEASVRHHLFNAVMILAGAYDRQRRTPDPGRFSVGLERLQRSLQVEYAVFPCAIEEQVLYAEWVDPAGKLVWSTTQRSSAMPVSNVGGQVALSNDPDAVKRLPNGGLARYGRFGFDPAKPQPTPYPEAVAAIGQLLPGAPIIYGPSSFVASISPCLAVPAIVDALVQREDCPKILFLNLTLNNETLGMSVTDFIDFWELNTGKPAAKTLDYIVVNKLGDDTPEIREALKDRGDSLETFKFRGPLMASDDDRRRVTQRGITLVEAPLASVSRQLMRLSSAGEREFVDVPSHNSERLMELGHALTLDFKHRDSRMASTPTRQLPLSSGSVIAVIHRGEKQ